MNIAEIMVEMFLGLWCLGTAALIGYEFWSDVVKPCMRRIKDGKED